MGHVEYDSNNSGGGWWLDDEQWFALEDAGWVVHWNHDWTIEHDGVRHEPPRFKLGEHHHKHTDPLLPAPRPDPEDGTRWLGALATGAAKETDDPAAAVAEWERVTGLDASDEGCNCCGEPHNFTYVDDDGNTSRTNVVVERTSLAWT